jgi:hypothetical protein
MAKKRAVCANCGGPTSFGETADAERVQLGWCQPCLTQSKRRHFDAKSGQTVWFDEMKTIDSTAATAYFPGARAGSVRPTDRAATAAPVNADKPMPPK